MTRRDILSTIGAGERPFTDNRPQILRREVTERACLPTCSRQVSIPVHAVLLQIALVQCADKVRTNEEDTYIIREDLVDVRIDCNTLEVRLRHEVLPIAEGLEGIVNELKGVALFTASVRETVVPGQIHRYTSRRQHLPNAAIGVFPVLFNSFEDVLSIKASRLVEWCDHD
jgi:hypothetical protein